MAAPPNETPPLRTLVLNLLADDSESPDKSITDQIREQAQGYVDLALDADRWERSIVMVDTKDETKLRTILGEVAVSALSALDSFEGASSNHARASRRTASFNAQSFIDSDTSLGATLHAKGVLLRLTRQLASLTSSSIIDAGPQIEG